MGWFVLGDFVDPLCYFWLNARRCVGNRDEVAHVARYCQL